MVKKKTEVKTKQPATYSGPTRNFRLPNPEGHADKYTWITLKDGDVIPDELLSKLGKEKQVEKAKERVKELEADLADDGKANFSHDKSKKSPGRKSKK